MTVGITSYNQGSLLRRAIQSVISQTYRPIEIIISDNSSEPPVWPAVSDLVSTSKAPDLTIKYFRQLENLGMSQNVQFVYRKARGRYFVRLDHDDVLADQTFLEFAVGKLESSEGCSIFVGNNRTEGTASLRMQIEPDFLEMFTGDDYIENFFVHRLRPAFGSTLTRRDLVNISQFESLFLSRCSATFLGVEPDDGFASLLLLAPSSKVLVSGIVGSIQGVVPNSLSRSEFWHRTSSLNIAVTYLNLYQQNYATQSQKRAVMESVLHRFPIGELSWRLIWYFRRSPAIIGLVLVSRVRARFPKRRIKHKKSLNAH